MADTFSFAQNFQHLYRFASKTGVRYSLIWAAVLFAFLASVFEGISLALLVPLLEGLVKGDYRFLMEEPYFDTILTRLPNHFPFGNRNFVVFLVSLTFGASIVKIFFQFLSQLLIVQLVRRFADGLRCLVYKRLLSFGKLYFDQQNQGYLQQLLSGYPGTVASAIHTLQSALSATFLLLIYFGLLFSISVPLSLIVIFIFPILHYAVRSVIAKVQQRSTFHSQSVNALMREISNSLSMIPLVKAYSNESSAHNRFAQKSNQVARAEIALEQRVLCTSPIQEIVSLCFLFILVGAIGFLISADGEWLVAEYMVFLVVLRRAAVMFGTINNIRTSIAQIGGPIKEIASVFSDEEKFFITDGQLPFRELRDSIEIKNLSFHYPTGVRALDNITFRICQGKTTALIGESGAGKSTLVNLLLRLYDAPAGTILIDGVSICQLNLKQWRAAIAVVSQDTYLFHGSIRENITFGLKTMPTDVQLDDILKQACLEDLVAQLPDGLETEVGDRGVKLSGGEKQRVSIARAIAKGSQILLLDEATSALDSKTEREVQTALENLMRGRTSLVIAHRLSTIRHADHIVVLENGQLVEQGELQPLMKQRGRFFTFWNEQRFS